MFAFDDFCTGRELPFTIYHLGKVVNFGPPTGLIPPSFQGHPHCSCIFEWCRNDGMGKEWQGWKLEWPLGRLSTSRHSWPSPIIPRPSLSFRWDEDQSHSKSFHLGMTPKWEISHSKVIPTRNELRMIDFQKISQTIGFQFQMTLNDMRMSSEWPNDIRMMGWLWNDIRMREWRQNELGMMEWH